MKTISKVVALILMVAIYVTEAGVDVDFYGKLRGIVCKNNGKDITDAQVANIKTNCKIPDVNEGDPLLKCTGKTKITDREHIEAVCNTTVVDCIHDPKNMLPMPAGMTTPSPQVIKDSQEALLVCLKKQLGQ